MGVTKSDLFSEEQNEIAATAKVFAHPARVAIVEYLLQTNSCFNGDLVKELGLAQATVSQHLRELKNSGIIKGSIEGVSVNYCINPDRWKQVKQKFENFFSQFQEGGGPDCC